MTTPKFSFFKTKKLRIGDQEIEIEGYHVIDSEYVIPLIEKRNEAYEIGTEYQQFIEKIEKKKGKNITPEDARQIKKMKDRIDKLLVEVSQISYPLAQRGIKRALYKNTKEYKEAEKENKTTEYIDKLPDIELPPYAVTEIVNTMLELGNPDLIGVPSEDERNLQQKKRRGKQAKKRSGSSSKDKFIN